MAKGNQRLEVVLGAVPLFDGLSKRHLKRLANMGEVADFMADHTIVREGDPGDSFFVILAGQAKVVANGKRLTQLVPGDYFGEISLLDGDPRSATVTSETPMTMMMMSRPRFLKVLRDEPDIAMHLLANLSRAVRRTTKSIAN